MKLLLPKVSVVIPSFNKGNLIMATLVSVYNSDYKGELEVILIDDKSTDPVTLAAYKKAEEKYSKLRFFVNQNKPQKVYGPASARNLGISKSSGKYIVLLDSDDLLSRNFIGNMVEFAEKNSNADFFYTDLILFDDNSLRLRRTPEFSSEKLKIYNYIPVTCLYKKEILDKIGGFDQDILSMEDWELILRLSLNGFNAKKLDRKDTFLYYRQNSPGSVNAIASSVKKRIFVRNQIQRKNGLYGFKSVFWNMVAVIYSFIAKSTARKEQDSFNSLPAEIKKRSREIVQRAI